MRELQALGLVTVGSDGRPEVTRLGGIVADLPDGIVQALSGDLLAQR